MKTFTILFSLSGERILILILLTMVLTMYSVMSFYRNGTRIETDKSSSFIGLILFLALVFGVVFLASKFQERKPSLPQEVNAPSNRPSVSAKIVKPVSTSPSAINSSPIRPISRKPVNMEQVVKVRPPRTLHEEFAFQVLSTSSSGKAHDLANSINHETIVEPEDGLFKVLIVGFKTYQEAKGFEQTCGREGFVRLFTYWK